jgi:hypothetical protein
MAQHDYVIANGTGAAVRSDINNGLAAIVSNNSGATAPSTTYAYQWWADTSTNLLKLRNGANSSFITVGDLTATNLGLAALASPTFTGTVTIPTATISTGAGIPLASAASPAIYFTGDTNTGIYSPGADQFAITTGGSGRVFVDSSGRVGLGTSSPGDYNSNANTLVVGNTSSNQGITISAGTASASAIHFADGTAGDASYRGILKYEHSNDRFLFGTAGGNTALTIDSSQRVGIGTTSPARLLHVSSLSSDGHIAVEAGTSNAAFIDFRINGTNKHYVGSASLLGSGTNDSMTVWNSANGYMNFGTNGTERARIDSSGRLLVGTSTARSNFFNSSSWTPQIQSEAASDKTTSLSLVCSANNGEQGILLLGNNRGSVGGNAIVQNSDGIGIITFQGNDGSEMVEGARIQAVVDGTPGANDLPTRLEFSTTADGASSPTERTRISNAGAFYHFSASGDTIAVASTKAAGTTDYFFTGGYSSSGPMNFGTNSIRIWTNGNIQNTNNSYTAISDIKLKENIVDAGSQWADLKALRVRNYNLKEGQTHRQIGLVAQEVEAISPGLVFESPDRDPEGNDLGTVTKSVNYSVLYMKAVKALQEAMERIEALEAKVAALEAS